MKFMIQIDNSMKEDSIVLKGCIRNKDHLQNIVILLQKSTVQFKIFDDEHNLYIIPCQDIYYIENVDNKVFVYTKNQVYRSFIRFSYLKKQLYDICFRQINKNTLVNMIHIYSVHIEKECHRILILDNKEKLIVNRSFRSILEEVSSV